jgi:hypothetical protein
LYGDPRAVHRRSASSFSKRAGDAPGFGRTPSSTGSVPNGQRVPTPQASLACAANPGTDSLPLADDTTAQVLARAGRPRPQAPRPCSVGGVPVLLPEPRAPCGGSPLDLIRRPFHASPVRRATLFWARTRSWGEISPGTQGCGFLGVSPRRGRALCVLLRARSGPVRCARACRKARWIAGRGRPHLDRASAEGPSWDGRSCFRGDCSPLLHNGLGQTPPTRGPRVRPPPGLPRAGLPLRPGLALSGRRSKTHLFVA